MGKILLLFIIIAELPYWQGGKPNGTLPMLVKKMEQAKGYVCNDGANRSAQRISEKRFLGSIDLRFVYPPLRGTIASVWLLGQAFCEAGKTQKNRVEVEMTAPTLPSNYERFITLLKS